MIGAVRNALGERLTTHQLHDEELVAVMFLEAVDGGDVLVIELGKEPRFSLETFQAPLVSCECLGEDLDRNIAIELCIACSINLASSR